MQAERCLTYQAPHAATTRPDLELPDGVTHVTNISGGDLVYWASRNELAGHVFRKGYMHRIYDTSVLLLGEPRATAEYSSSELIEMGLVGIYGKRR